MHAYTAVHTGGSYHHVFDCKADLVGQQSSDGYRMTHPVSKISGYAGALKININRSLNYTNSVFHNFYFITQALLNGWIGHCVRLSRLLVFQRTSHHCTFIHSFKQNCQLPSPTPIHVRNQLCYRQYTQYWFTY